MGGEKKERQGERERGTEWDRERQKAKECAFFLTSGCTNSAVTTSTIHELQRKQSSKSDQTNSYELYETMSSNGPLVYLLQDHSRICPLVRLCRKHVFVYHLILLHSIPKSFGVKRIPINSVCGVCICVCVCVCV